ncbi:hypothetical protein GQ457_01G016650 [Hibiscus cannabinus]
MALEEDSKVTSNSSKCDLTYNVLFKEYEELQEVHDELYEKYKESLLKHKKIISDLKFDRDSLYEAHYDLELKMKSMQANRKVLEKKIQDLHGLLSKVQDDRLKEVGDLKASLSKVGKNNFQNPSSSKPNYVKRIFNGYKQRSFLKTSKGKMIISVWVPKELITSNNISAIATWIPKGTKVLGANTHGPKMILGTKSQNIIFVCRESIATRPNLHVEIHVRNKARLVAQGYTQEEGIDFDETYATVVRMEAIIMLLAFACHHEFKPFQMDVKSVLLNGFISEEVYVEQPPSFEDPNFSNHVFELSKALYGLKQAPRAWYKRLSSF